MVGNIHDQVLTHHGQTDETEVTTGINPRWSADIDAGKTCARVSQLAINIAPSGKNDSCRGLIEQGSTLRSLRTWWKERDKTKWGNCGRRIPTYTAFSVILAAC